MEDARQRFQRGRAAAGCWRCFFVFPRPAAASCLTPLGPGSCREKCASQQNFLSVSVLIFICVTDGAADSGELDLSGIDDREIELVRTCNRNRKTLSDTCEAPETHIREREAFYCWTQIKDKAKNIWCNRRSSSVSLQYLLSDKEIKIKTALWMAENSDYLKEQKGTLRMWHGLCFRADINFYSLAGLYLQCFISQTESKPPAEPRRVQLVACGHFPAVSRRVDVVYLTVCVFSLFLVSAFREGSKDSEGEGARDPQRKEGNRIQPERA